MLIIGRIVTRSPFLLERAHSGMGQLGAFFRGSRSEPDGCGGYLREVPKWQRHSLTPVLLGSQMSTPQYVIYLTLDYHTLIIPAVTMWCYYFICETPWDWSLISTMSTHTKLWNYLGPFWVSLADPIISGEPTKRPQMEITSLFSLPF